MRKAWEAWAGLIADRVRAARRLDDVVQVHRLRAANDEPRLRRALLDALAEFAAGAGHELNNPLAVIVGRAQLLLAKAADPATIKSLGTIISQAQRAHRILRDLMFVARTPELRPRFCQVDEIIRSCVRDLRTTADDRGIRIQAETFGTEAKLWTDPDAVRHLTETLLRNALEATPKGGTVQITATASPVSVTEGPKTALDWMVRDSGRGLGASEAAHLFDPFYCGREAGRGLGLGLPRAARYLRQAGGEVRWHSTPGQGSVFHVHLPLTEPPKPPQPIADPTRVAVSIETAPHPK